MMMGFPEVVIAAISIIIPAAVIIYALVLLTRLVKATEKIAENTSKEK